MVGKEFWKSKTLYFNILVLVVIVAEAFGYVDFVPNENTAEYAAAVITVINVILRFVTKEPLRIK